MLNDFRDPLSAVRFLIVVCGCSSRPPKGLKLMLQALRLMKIHLIAVVLGTKPPSWLHQMMDKESLIAVRWNTGPERIALKVLEAMDRRLSMLGFLK